MKTIRILFAFLLFSFTAIVLAAPVNINTAEAVVMAKNIKGIGMKKAQAIVNYRDTYGNFSKPEDIMKVKGIGKKMFEKIQDSILVNIEKDPVH